MTRTIEIHDSVEEVSRRAADIFAKEALAASGRFSVALSGGTTPGRLYSILADEYAEIIRWEDVHFFSADERCVPKDHPSSNFKLANDLLLSRVPVPERNIHRIHGELGSDQAAITYERDLEGFFGLSLPRFDLILLGAGSDGHTASIFPDSTVDSAKTAVPVQIARLNSNRVTLTLPVLNNAATVVFVVTGENKAEIVRDVVVDRVPFPAARVNPQEGNTVWLVDSSAAALLPGREVTVLEF